MLAAPSVRWPRGARTLGVERVRGTHLTAPVAAPAAPLLQSKSEATAELLTKVAADQEEAEKVSRTVAAEEREVKVRHRVHRLR